MSCYCTCQGYFWKQFIIPIGSGLTTQIKLYDAVGHPITDEDTVSYLTKHVPDLAEFEILKDGPVSTTRTDDSADQIVALRGSSTCFEYQFPAAPTFYVGRANLLAEVDQFVVEILANQTSAHDLLFEANYRVG